MPLNPPTAHKPARSLWGRLGLITLSAVLLGACSPAPRDTHPQQWVSKRQAAFKELTRLLEPIGLHARGRKEMVAVELREGVQALRKASDVPWALFPADSNYPPTRAKPGLWLQPAEFKAAQNAYLSKVDALVAASAGTDPTVLRDAVDAVEKSCKNCHNQYRSDR